MRGGKSSFATNVFDSISIPAYNRRNSVARELAAQGRRAADETRAGDEDLMALAEARVDDAAARFWNLGKRQQAAMQGALEVLH